MDAKRGSCEPHCAPCCSHSSRSSHFWTHAAISRILMCTHPHKETPGEWAGEVCRILPADGSPASACHPSTARTPWQTHLVTSQDLEGSHDLVCCICVGRLTGHKVDEGLECHYPQAVGVHNAHDSGKFCLSLERRATPGLSPSEPQPAGTLCRDPKPQV